MLPPLLLLPRHAGAHGKVNGCVAVMDDYNKAYGFSTITGTWTPVNLEGAPAVLEEAGTNLGYLRTSDHIYAFNPTNAHWYSASVTGLPMGEDVNGATAVFWSNTGAWAIATTWALWRPQLMNEGEPPVGGGSANNFAVVWTTRNAYAYSAANGQWLPQIFTESLVDALVQDGFAIVWTRHTAMAFDPATRTWNAIDLGQVTGVSADGSGNVGLVWGDDRVQAFSLALNAWFPLCTDSFILGGAAAGNVGLVWDSGFAYAFDAQMGAWTPQPMPGSSPVDEGPVEPPVFRCSPNPSPGPMSFLLPSAGTWKLRILDAQGRLVRTLEGTGAGNDLSGRIGADSGSASSNGAIAWDGCDRNGRRVASGNYWVRAECGERVEVRRFVIVH